MASTKTQLCEEDIAVPLPGNNEDFFLDSLMAVLDGMRRNDILIDLVLQCSNGEELPAHKLVLSVVSPHFQGVLNKESSSKVTIILPQFITAESMRILLDFIYSGHLDLPQDINEVKQIIRTAHALELLDFDEYLTSSISSCLTSDNFVEAWDLADDFQNSQLEKAVRSFLRKDLVCFSQQPGFCQLTIPRLHKVLFETDEPLVPEHILLSTIFNWVHSDVEHRLEDMNNKLIISLNFDQLSKEYLQRLIREEQLVCKSKNLWLAIARALYRRGTLVPGYKDNEMEAVQPSVLQNSPRVSSAPQPNAREMHRLPPGDLRVLAGKTYCEQEIRLEQKPSKCFMSSKNPRKSSGPRHMSNFDGSPEQEQVILVVGRRRNGDSAMQCFRLKSNMWTTATDIEDWLTENAAWATQGYNLHFAGGMDSRHRVLESTCAFDIRTHKFSKTANMLIARHAARAATIGWHIYVVGGLGHNDKPLSHVERYDIFGDQWEAVQPLPYEAWEVGIAASDRYLWVIGGRTNKENKQGSAKVEKSHGIHVYDPEVDQWTYLGSMPDEFISSYPVATFIDKTVYMVRHYSSSVMWAFDTALRKWLRSYDQNVPGPRRVMTMIPFQDRLWIIYYGGKIALYNLTTQCWNREAPFSRTIAIPMYAARMNYPVEDQKFTIGTSPVEV